ncbi:hypothetical protein Tco_0947432 [Tanacetum coccineum]
MRDGMEKVEVEDGSGMSVITRTGVWAEKMVEIREGYGNGFGPGGGFYVSGGFMGEMGGVVIRVERWWYRVFDVGGCGLERVGVVVCVTMAGEREGSGGKGTAMLVLAGAGGMDFWFLSLTTWAISVGRDMLGWAGWDEGWDIRYVGGQCGPGGDIIRWAGQEGVAACLQVNCDIGSRVDMGFDLVIGRYYFLVLRLFGGFDSHRWFNKSSGKHIYISATPQWQTNRISILEML